MPGNFFQHFASASPSKGSMISSYIYLNIFRHIGSIEYVFNKFLDHKAFDRLSYFGQALELPIKSVFICLFIYFNTVLSSPNNAIFNLTSLASNASSVVAAATVITSRYGSGGGGSGGSRYSGNNPRQSRNAEPDDDGALDLSIIKSDSVRLIDVQQNMVGIVSKAEAIRMADDSELDLVVLSPDADPPVVRIMDYNKYRYELQKKKREQQKKSAASRMDLKELKMGYNIDQHDYSVRLKSARKFLKDGDKVKVVVSLKGRENEFRNFAIELIRRFQTDVGELATEETKNFRDRNIFIILVPNKAILQKAQEPPKKKEKSDAVDEEVSASV